MNTLIQILNKNLLLEKRIAQISAKIEVVFSFDVDRTTHAYIRKTRSDIENYDTREISNDEINYLIELSRREIAEKIVSNEIVNEEPFIIKSPEKKLTLAITPSMVSSTYWKLIIRTVFRESFENPFRVGKDQLVIWV